MKKVFIGGSGACGVHNEKYVLEDFLFESYDYTLSDDYKDADVIILIDTCAGTYRYIKESVDCIKNVLLTKKKDATVIVSGCITKKFSFELPDDLQSILNQVTLVPSSNIVEYVLNLLKFNTQDSSVKDWIHPFYCNLENGIQISPVTGCQNKCSFCKTNYMDFPLKSVPIERIETAIESLSGLNEYMDPIDFIHVHSSNLSLYGLDLYGGQRAHDLLSMLSKQESVKFLFANALINWYPELLNEVLNNPKIKSLFISLESGSDRVYKLMNRPISLYELRKVIRMIRESRPDILIDTEIICGFPTETMDDLNRTIDTIYELDVNPLFIHPYIDSPYIPSSKLIQYGYEYNKELSIYARDRLRPQVKKYKEFAINGELLVIDRDDISNRYKVVLINGEYAYIDCSEFDRVYLPGDVIPRENNNQVKRRVRMIR